MSDKIYNVLGKFEASGTIDASKIENYLRDKNVPKFVKSAVEELQGVVFSSNDNFIDELGKIIGEEKANKNKNKALKTLIWKSDASKIIIDEGHRIPRLMYQFFGKTLEINIEFYHTQRSNAQNRYLHGVVIPVIIAWAYETDGYRYSIQDVKSFLYEHVLKERSQMKQVFGVEVNVQEGKSFSSMTTTEFNNAIEYIQRYFLDRGCNIPNPTKSGFIANYIKKDGNSRS